ncbi:unnamed protein product [Meloidogyne enterolobii]|uniref:Uncharacterized protein n=1 Tax=Meloidogyne enterolobii TaxID=390850 RepID=A0ACB0Y7S4_MELEN
MSKKLFPSPFPFFFFIFLIFLSQFVQLPLNFFSFFSIDFPLPTILPQFSHYFSESVFIIFLLNNKKIK